MISRLLNLGFVFVAAVTTLGCSSGPIPPRIRPSSGADYEVSVVANDLKQRFEIRIAAIADRGICVFSPDLPWKDGRWLGLEGTYVVLIGNRRLSPPDQNPGSCVGSRCWKRIPAEGIIAAINYDVFGARDEILRAVDKKLEISLAIEFCSDVW